MDMLRFSLKIILKNENKIYFNVYYKHNYILVLFDIKTKWVIISNENKAKLLIDNYRQFLKMIRNIHSENLYAGFKLNFALWNGKDVRAFNNPENVVVIDKTKKDTKIYTKKREQFEGITCFTDASVNYIENIAGLSVIAKNTDNKYSVHNKKIKENKSTMAELKSAIFALEIFKEVNKIRLVTDSMYVKKGLTEWIHNWRVNDYKTVNNTDVKNKELWQKLNNLISDKYIEFYWVKAHREHFENTLCDIYSKETAQNYKEGK